MSELRFACSQCERTYSRQGSLESHMRLKHSEGTASDDVVDGSTIAEDVGNDVPTEPVNAPMGGGGMGQDADPLLASGERRPGEGLPSSPGVDGAPPGKPRGRLAKLFGAKAKDGGAPGAVEKRPVGRPPAKGKRVSGAETLSDVWGGIGGFVGRNPAHVPLGRYMQFQAPVAGEMLDEAVAGTVVDKVALQPIFKARGKFDLIGAVFGPPALIYAIERNPERAALMVPMLRTSIRNALPLMVPAIKRIQTKEAKTAEAASDLFDSDPAFAQWHAEATTAGVKNPDPADYILSMIFDGWAPSEAPPEQTPTDVVV
jgi:hypothetical protein